MDQAQNDRIAARAVLSCVGEVCYRAAEHEGDTTIAHGYEKKLRTAMERISEERMQNVVRFTLEYIGGKYNLEDPIAVRGELELLINHERLT